MSCANPSYAAVLRKTAVSCEEAASLFVTGPVAAAIDHEQRFARSAKRDHEGTQPHGLCN